LIFVYGNNQFVTCYPGRPLLPVPSAVMKMKYKHYMFLFVSWCLTQQYFSYIVAVSFIGGGNRRTGRKPTTGRKSWYIAQGKWFTYNILHIVSTKNHQKHRLFCNVYNNRLFTHSRFDS